MPSTETSSKSLVSLLQNHRQRASNKWNPSRITWSWSLICMSSAIIGHCALHTLKTSSSNATWPGVGPLTRWRVQQEPGVRRRVVSSGNGPASSESTKTRQSCSAFFLASSTTHSSSQTRSLSSLKEIMAWESHRFWILQPWLFATTKKRTVAYSLAAGICASTPSWSSNMVFFMFL